MQLLFGLNKPQPHFSRPEPLVHRPGGCKRVCAGSARQVGRREGTRETSSLRAENAIHPRFSGVPGTASDLHLPLKTYDVCQSRAWKPNRPDVEENMTLQVRPSHTSSEIPSTFQPHPRPHP